MVDTPKLGNPGNLGSYT
jgi:hypothetical protein